jgi:hypothetical protein
VAVQESFWPPMSLTPRFSVPRYSQSRGSDTEPLGAPHKIHHALSRARIGVLTSVGSVH